MTTTMNAKESLFVEPTTAKSLIGKQRGIMTVAFAQFKSVTERKGLVVVVPLINHANLVGEIVMQMLIVLEILSVV